MLRTTHLICHSFATGTKIRLTPVIPREKPRSHTTIASNIARTGEESATCRRSRLGAIYRCLWHRRSSPRSPLLAALGTSPHRYVFVSGSPSSLSLSLFHLLRSVSRAPSPFALAHFSHSTHSLSSSLVAFTRSIVPLFRARVSFLYQNKPVSFSLCACARSFPPLVLPVGHSMSSSLSFPRGLARYAFLHICI